MAQYMVCHSFPKGWGFLGRNTQPVPKLFVPVVIDSSKYDIQHGMKLVDMLALHASTKFQVWKNYPHNMVSPHMCI